MPEDLKPAAADLAPIVKESEAIVSQVSPVVFAVVVFIAVLLNHALFTEAVSYWHRKVTMPLLKTNRWWLGRPAIYLSFFAMVASHLVEIGLWGYALVWAGFLPTVPEAVYFSGSTYTTLGYGTDPLPGASNAITVVIALSGMFSIAWTTSALMSMIRDARPEAMGFGKN